MDHRAGQQGACSMAQYCGIPCSSRNSAPSQLCNQRSARVVVETTRLPHYVTTTHQGASQASHLRLWPGGGGVSPNRMPFLSVRVPSLKKPGPPDDAFGRKLRSARTGTRDNDMLLWPQRSAGDGMCCCQARSWAKPTSAACAASSMKTSRCRPCLHACGKARTAFVSSATCTKGAFFPPATARQSRALRSPRHCTMTPKCALSSLRRAASRYCVACAHTFHFNLRKVR